jgi:hypothetical protein
MKVKHVGYVLILSAIIWGAVIVGCSLKLRGTNCYEEISNILIGGTLTHIVLIMSSMGMLAGNKKKEKQETQ